MTAVLLKMTEMVLMMLVGFVCAKLKITGPEFNKYTSTLLTNVLLPATILKSSIGVEIAISNGAVFFILALYLVMMGVAWVVSTLTVKLLPLNEDESGVLHAVVMYMNVAFIGFPLAETMYGSDGLFYACLSALPFNALFFSLGAISLQGNKGAFQPKVLLHPALVATAIGIVLFLLRLPVPGVIYNTIGSVGGATVPISMIVLGTSLAGVDLKSAFSDWRVYAASLMRLVICPIAVYYVIGLLTDDPVLLGTVTILSATPSAVALTALCIQYGRDERLASKSIFITTILSAFTLPFVIWLLL